METKWGREEEKCRSWIGCFLWWTIVLSLKGTLPSKKGVGLERSRDCWRRKVERGRYKDTSLMFSGETGVWVKGEGERVLDVDPG